MYLSSTAGNQYIYRSPAEINSAMAGVYKHMAMAVFISMLVAYAVSTSPALLAFLFTGAMKWIVIFAPVVAVFGITFALNNNPSKGIAQLLLLGFSALMGLSFATIFVVYKISSIFTAFMGAGILFGTMSFYGYFTKRSLDSFGKFLFIALIAIFIAGLINLFIGNSIAQIIISSLAILIFTGLTAYDTQKIREMISYESDKNVEIVGALTLYLDFINIFLNLLQILGEKKD